MGKNNHSDKNTRSNLTALMLLAEEVKETERICGGPSKGSRPLFDLAARAVKDADEASCAFLLAQLVKKTQGRLKSGQTQGLSPEFLERFRIYQQFLERGPGIDGFRPPEPAPSQGLTQGEDR